MQPSAPAEPPRVLVVVDEPDLATTCVRYLRQTGYTSRMAASGQEALCLIDQRWPDLVFAEARLSGPVDGLAILHHARHGAPGPGVILCAARPAELSRRQAFDAGAVDYVVKPFSLADLRRAVERALAARAGDERPGAG